MSRNHRSSRKSLLIAAAVALVASGGALADDSSMSMWTGDSYAFFNHLDYSAGKFNTAHVPAANNDDAVAKSPRKIEKPEPRDLVAAQPRKGMVLSPFRNDTGA